MGTVVPFDSQFRRLALQLAEELRTSKTGLVRTRAEELERAGVHRSTFVRAARAAGRQVGWPVDVGESVESGTVWLYVADARPFPAMTDGQRQTRTRAHLGVPDPDDAARTSGPGAGPGSGLGAGGASDEDDETLDGRVARRLRLLFPEHDGPYDDPFAVPFDRPSDADNRRGELDDPFDTDDPPF